jgi:hypothetical protein
MMGDGGMAGTILAMGYIGPNRPVSATPTSSSCQPTGTPGSSVFYLFHESYRSCSGSQCGDSEVEVGIIPGDKWNCNDLAAVDFGNTDLSSYPYAPGSAEFRYMPDTFVLQDTQHVCGTNALTFKAQCDG